MSIKNWSMLIDGVWCESNSGDRLDTVDPATEEVIATIPRGNAVDIDNAIQAASAALEGPWSLLKPKDRARILFDIGKALEKRVEEFALLETRDAGKPLQLSRKEILGTARYFEYYAGAADKIQGSTIPLGPDYLDFTLREPIGVTAHIIPWNMPLNMVGRSVAPALAAGNTAVVKPSEMTSQTALLLGELMIECGLPRGVYNVVTGLGNEAGEPLCTHEGIDAITFTGSVTTGRRVMRNAAEHIKPVVLELGGKSPHIIFADADPDLAAAEVAKGIYANSGQVCSAGSRLIVDNRIKDAVLQRLVDRSRKIVVGPGMQEPDMGPLVSDEHHDRVMGYIQSGSKQGADLIYGGEPDRDRRRRR